MHFISPLQLGQNVRLKYFFLEKIRKFAICKRQNGENIFVPALKSLTVYWSTAMPAQGFWQQVVSQLDMAASSCHGSQQLSAVMVC